MAVVSKNNVSVNGSECCVKESDKREMLCGKEKTSSMEQSIPKTFVKPGHYNIVKISIIPENENVKNRVRVKKIDINNKICFQHLISQYCNQYGCL